MDDRLQDRHFEEIARRIESHSGIRLPAAKRVMIEGRLRKRVRSLGLTNLGEYGEELFEGGLLDDEFDHVVDCVTTNKTDFFREPEHFDYLVKTAIPTLRRERAGSAQNLKLWSAAASIGAEAYTLAMVLAELFGRDAARFSILGTDLSHEVLRQARHAVYPSLMAEPIPESMMARYAMRSRDPSREVFRIVPELRRRCRFDLLNLMDESYPYDNDFDVIFCRNVLIYFSRDNQHAVVERLASHLRPGGYLILGHTESVHGDDHPRLRQAATTIFRRVG